MDWDDFRYFLAVARTGQFLAAARLLRVNHATVARRVTVLEESLGTKLFVRRTTGCDLTSEGDALLRRLESVERSIDAIRSELGGVDEVPTGTVRVGAPDGFGVAFLAPRLGRFRQMYPRLKIQLVPVPRSFSLSKREADIAVTTARPTEGRLIARKLVDYSLGLYASKSYVSHHGVPQSAGDLRSHTLIGYVDDLIFSQSLNYSHEIWKDWETDIAISTAMGQVEAVRGGAGIGILHDFIARQTDALVQVLPELLVRRSYWLVVHEDYHSLRRVTAVADFIGDEVAANRHMFLPMRQDGFRQASLPAQPS